MKYLIKTLIIGIIFQIICIDIADCQISKPVKKNDGTLAVRVSVDTLIKRLTVKFENLTDSSLFVNKDIFLDLEMTTYNVFNTIRILNFNISTSTERDIRLYELRPNFSYSATIYYFDYFEKWVDPSGIDGSFDLLICYLKESDLKKFEYKKDEVGVLIDLNYAVLARKINFNNFRSASSKN